MLLMDIIIPQDIVGDIDECVIVTWLKHIGDDIESDETLLIIQAAKTSYDIAAPVGGKVVEILAEQGDVVNTTQVLARIETADSPPDPPSDAVEKAPSETPSGEQQKATGE